LGEGTGKLYILPDCFLPKETGAPSLAALKQYGAPPGRLTAWRSYWGYTIGVYAKGFWQQSFAQKKVRLRRFLFQKNFSRQKYVKQQELPLEHVKEGLL
jgi:hypothetical protein